jgi:quercetin dioxygenase-like cupin family protein
MKIFNRTKHDINLRRIDKMITKSKRLLKLDFFGFQSIAKLQNEIVEGETMYISGNLCTPIKVSKNKSIEWVTYAPIGAEFEAHFHDWSETITMTKGVAEVDILEGFDIVEVIRLKKGDSYKIESGVSHTFRNVDSQEIVCHVLHERE